MIDNGCMKFTVDANNLRSLHRFGDIYEEAIRDICSVTAAFTPDRLSADCIGPHWYGMRCRVDGLTTGYSLCLHTGLIFLPETRCGLMVELDRRSNENVFSAIWDAIENCECNGAYEINKMEDEYLKLFMPDEVYASMESMDRREQKRLLGTFFLTCAEAMIKAAGGDPFCFSYKNMADTYWCVTAIRNVLKEASGENYSVEMNIDDKDNFGRYASGYRYWLTDKESGVRMYAYFGVIYSYRKDPVGVFAEIDRYSNVDAYNTVLSGLTEEKDDAERWREASSWYKLSMTEDGFIKMFLTGERVDELNTADADGQHAILGAFLKSCNDALVYAARDGRRM